MPKFSWGEADDTEREAILMEAALALKEEHTPGTPIAYDTVIAALNEAITEHQDFDEEFTMKGAPQIKSVTEALIDFLSVKSDDFPGMFYDIELKAKRARTTVSASGGAPASSLELEQLGVDAAEADEEEHKLQASLKSLKTQYERAKKDLVNKAREAKEAKLRLADAQLKKNKAAAVTAAAASSPAPKAPKASKAAASAAPPAPSSPTAQSPLIKFLDSLKPELLALLKEKGAINKAGTAVKTAYDFSVEELKAFTSAETRKLYDLKIAKDE